MKNKISNDFQIYFPLIFKYGGNHLHYVFFYVYLPILKMSILSYLECLFFT